MSLLILKLLAAFLIFFISILAGLSPLRRQINASIHQSKLGEAAASGIFLGAALFHMLPDAQIGFYRVYGTTPYPYANLLCALGFVLLLFLEKVILHRAKTRALAASTLSSMLAVVLSVHAFTEGAALGINSLLSSATIIMIAILAHKGSESFALGVSLSQSSMAMKRKIQVFVFFALMTPLGIGLGFLLTDWLQNQTGQLLEAGFNAFAAGTFLYIATLHQLHHVHCEPEHAAHLQEFIATLLGLGLMALLAIWV